MNLPNFFGDATLGSFAALRFAVWCHLCDESLLSASWNVSFVSEFQLSSTEGYLHYLHHQLKLNFTSLIYGKTLPTVKYCKFNNHCNFMQKWQFAVNAYLTICNWIWKELASTSSWRRIQSCSNIAFTGKHFKYKPSSARIQGASGWWLGRCQACYLRIGDRLHSALFTPNQDLQSEKHFNYRTAPNNETNNL